MKYLGIKLTEEVKDNSQLSALRTKRCEKENREETERGTQCEWSWLDLIADTLVP